MADIFNFGVKPITCHAWNHDKSQIALSTNNNDVQIYQRAGKKWSLIHTLCEHTLKVTGKTTDNSIDQRLVAVF